MPSTTGQFIVGRKQNVSILSGKWEAKTQRELLYETVHCVKGSREELRIRPNEYLLTAPAKQGLQTKFFS